MKTHLIAVSLVVAALGFTSCQKCTDCSCTGTTEFTFSDSISTADQESIQMIYQTDFDNIYPDESVEVCEKRGDFDATIVNYEAQSVTYEENQKKNGFPWSLIATYECVCVE